MPAVNQSLVPYNPLGRPNYGDGTSYTNSVDACLAISGQLAGALAVVPNSPAAMSVLVDIGYTIPRPGQTVPAWLNNGAAPQTVSLAAPGSNSYYATIYWNLLTATAGAIYGAPATSPTPIIPDGSYQVPLAFVLIASTDTTIIASKIVDARFVIPDKPLTASLGLVTTNQIVNCQGASIVHVNMVLNAYVTLTLNNLRYGVPIFITATNVNAASVVLKLGATTPSGLTYAINGKIAGTNATPTDMAATGATLTTGDVILLIGSIVPGQAIMFAIC